MTGFLSILGGRRRDRDGRGGRPRRVRHLGPSSSGWKGVTCPPRSGPAAPPAPPQVLSAQDVEILLERAARASASEDAIIAVVDRNGPILGVRVEAGVSPAITGEHRDARLRHRRRPGQGPHRRLLRQQPGPADLADDPVHQPDDDDPARDRVEPEHHRPELAPARARLRRPDRHEGALPARVMFTPQVDLFAIEHTNRDSIISPGADRIRGTADDIPLREPVQRRPGVRARRARSSPRRSRTASSRACCRTPSRAASARCRAASRSSRTARSSAASASSSPGRPASPPRRTRPSTTPASSTRRSPTASLEAEYIAFVAAGGSKTAGVSFNTPAKNRALGLPSFPAGATFDLPFGRIDLVGITLDIFGGHGRQGPRNLVDSGRGLGLGDPDERPAQPAGRPRRATRLLGGEPVPEGWLVPPHDSADGTLTAADVTAIVERGIAEANRVRAAIRLPLDSTARMVFAVTDTTGEVLGLFRMPDATVFSIDVAVAKARNVAYYADPAQLQPIDQVPGLPRRRRVHQPDVPLPGRAALPRGDRQPPARPVLDPQRDGRPHGRGPPARLGLPDRARVRRLQPAVELPRPVQRGQPERDRLLPRQRAALQGHRRRRRPRPGRRPRRQRRRRRPGRRRDVPGGDRLPAAVQRPPRRSGLRPRRPPAVPEVQPAAPRPRRPAARPAGEAQADPIRPGSAAACPPPMSAGSTSSAGRPSRWPIPRGGRPATGPAAPDDVNEGPRMRRPIRCLVFASGLAAVSPGQSALGGHFFHRAGRGRRPPASPAVSSTRIAARGIRSASRPTRT